MPPNYLFGPVDPAFADQCLGPDRRAGRARAFSFDPGADLVLGPADTWDEIAGRHPAGWRPDFIALRLDYTHVPHGFWDAPVPLVGLAGDWNLLWHHYARCLVRCERVLTDQAGVARLTAAGFDHARYFNLFGCRDDDPDRAWPDGPRDIDVLFVGNLQDAIQRERLPWVARLAALGARWNVVIRTNVYGEEYRRLLGRARVAFNRSIRGEANLRAFEAACAGAVLFQEAGNREVPAFFADRREYVAYSDADLEGLLEFYLTHEGERRAVATAARARVRDYRFSTLWAEAAAAIERDLPDLRGRVGRRPRPTGRDRLLARAWQDVCSAPRRDTGLPAALAAAAAPGDAALHTALGVIAGDGPGGAGAAAEHFRRAAAADPADPLLRLNLAEALAVLGHAADATAECRAGLEALAAGRPGGEVVLPHFPARYDVFRVEWERAGWEHAGDRVGERQARRTLLAWRLHGLLARLTGSTAHRYEAVLCRADLPTARAALAAALIQDGHPAEAAAHLGEVVAANPFAPGAARTLFDVLGQLGRAGEREEVARSRRLLARAAPQVAPPEPWFAPPSGPPPAGAALPAPHPAAAAPPGHRPDAPAGLASLVILCCNELEYTRQCLESVLRHTRPPYELILLDNGSTDGTPAFLAEIRSRPGPARVALVRNEENLGFVRGTNQGIALARGRYVVFLNNDTVVTPGWLAGLIDCLEAGGPGAGLAGPVSNATAAPQQIAVGYADLAGIDAFAARRRAEFGSGGVPAHRLAGFCLVVRAEVLARVGGLDERYGVGFFDDFDLCVRAREAGFGLLVAPGVFVHHYLSRTFAGRGIDVAAQFRANLDRFVAKWGRDRAARYLPDMADRFPESVPAAPRPRERVSLCVIARDEEDNLPACLDGAAGLFDEAVVVDTGSTDRTKEIAARYGAKVFDFPWADSFAAARNESLRRATGGWAFWLDADDRLDEPNRAALRTVLAALTPAPAVYLMRCAVQHGAADRQVVEHARLFKNDPVVRWEYRVHEQIAPAAQRAGWPVRRAPVTVRHDGYADPAVRQAKLRRNLRLLELDRAERPGDPVVLFHLGSVQLDLGQPGAAVPLLERSITRCPPGHSLAGKAHAHLVLALRQLGRAGDALRACRAGRARLPREPELVFYEGLLLQEAGDPVGAEGRARELLALPPAPELSGTDAELQGHKARHNLALALRDQGRGAEAEVEWRAVVAGQPHFTPAWLGLAGVWSAPARRTDLEREAARAAERATADPLAQEVADLLGAKQLLTGGADGPATDLLRGAAGRFPYAAWPRLLLAEVACRTGVGPAAEAALRAVLALDPNHLPTRRRLAELAKDTGPPLPAPTAPGAPEG